MKYITQLALTFISLVSYVVAENKNVPELPLWPYPHEVSINNGKYEPTQGNITIPSNANRKNVIIAELLAKRLTVEVKKSIPTKITNAGTSKIYPYALSCGTKIDPDRWNNSKLKEYLNKIHPTLHEQSYFLEITPDGITILSPGSSGLLYGTTTLMQLVRCYSEQKALLPCVTIIDYPEIEIRACHLTRAPLNHRKLAGVYAFDCKVNMFVWENYMTGFAPEIHPELGLKPGITHQPLPPYNSAIQEIRALGIEVVPLRNMSVGHARQSGLIPYVFLGEDETYYWAMENIIDSELEAFTPRYFHIGMDEEQYSMKEYLYPVRDLKKWRDVAIVLTRHLRRRGVMPMMWSELLFPQWGGKSQYFNWKGEFGGPFPTGYEEFLATFPREMILIPWYYWVKNPEETLEGKGDLRRQAKTGLPVMPGATENNVEHHTMAVKLIKNQYPNAIGVITTSWGGDTLYQERYPRYPEYVRRAAGPFWNVNFPGNWTPKEAKAVSPVPFWNTKFEKIFQWPTTNLDSYLPNLECLLAADPPDSIEMQLEKLKDKDWRVWTTARERLVASGFTAVPALLTAMTQSKGEIKERVEGCLSRIARNARHNKKYGTLDMASIMKFLSHEDSDVRDITAEIIVSSSNDGYKHLLKLTKDKKAGASCIKAIGIIKEASACPQLLALLSDSDADENARIESAKVLGILKYKEAENTLRRVLVQTKNKELKKASLWSLALLGCQSADKDISPLLESDDKDLRFRSAIALAILQSSEVKKLEGWFTKDRHSMELALWALWKTGNTNFAKEAIRKAISLQKDELSRKRLEMIDKTGWNY